MRLNSKNILSQFIIKEDGIHYMKICKGCKTYDNEMNSLSYDQKRKYTYLCNISVPFKGKELCPCSECIVKMMCSAGCEKLNSYCSRVPKEVNLKK